MNAKFAKSSSDIESDFRNGFENRIEYLWPLLAKTHKNAFDATTGSSYA